MVFSDTEHDGDGRCCTFGRECRGEASWRNDHRDLPANQLTRQLRQLFELLGPAVVDRHAFDIACLSETLAKRAQTLDAASWAVLSASMIRPHTPARRHRTKRL